MTSDSNCPKCHLMDRALKVSAIITGQTHQLHGSSHESSTYVDKDGKTHTSYYNVPYNATQTSVLAQQLAPPRQPKVEGGGCGRIIGVVVVLIIIFVFANFIPPAMSIVILILGYLILAPLNTDLSQLSMTVRIIMSLAGIVMALVGTAVFLAGSYWLIKLIIKEVKAGSKRSAEKRQRQLAEFQAEMPRWEHAMRRWNQLYYCERDDLVFIPGEKTGVPREQMMDYIYK